MEQSPSWKAVTQLVKKYPAFLWNPEVHYHVNISLPLDPILSQPNSVRCIHPYLPKVHLTLQRLLMFQVPNLIFFFPSLRSCQTITPGLRRFETFRNHETFLQWGVLSPTPNPKLKDHPLSDNHDCLFNIFAATLHTQRTSLHLQPEDVPCCGHNRPT